MCAGRARAKETILTVLKLIDAFAFYGFDTLLLAALTALTVQLIKKIFKRAQKKLFTFLPFAVGTLYYAVYAGLINMSFYYLLDEYASVLEHGVSVGASATLLYVLYELFVRDKAAENPAEAVIAALIEGYVPSEKVEAAAAAIAEAIRRDVTGDGALRAAEILTSNAEGEICESDIKLLSKLIIETLAHISA